MADILMITGEGERWCGVGEPKPFCIFRHHWGIDFGATLKECAPLPPQGGIWLFALEYQDEDGVYVYREIRLVEKVHKIEHGSAYQRKLEV